MVAHLWMYVEGLILQNDDSRQRHPRPISDLRAGSVVRKYQLLVKLLYLEGFEITK